MVDLGRAVGGLRRVLSHPLARALMVVAVLALAYFKWLPFPWRQPLVAALAILVLAASGQKLADMGVRWPIALRSTLVWAVVGALLTCAVIMPVIEPLLNRMLGIEADYSGYGALRDNLPATVRLIAFAWISAAIGEELIFRGYLLSQLLTFMGNRLPAQIVAVLLGAVVFGLSHHTQGLVGGLLTGITGALMGAIFLLSQRNIWAVILAHGLIDTWGVLTLYWGWY